MIVLISKGTYKSSLGWLQDKISVPTAEILKAYTEALTGFSHIFSPDGLNNFTLSQGYIFGKAPTVGMVGRTYIPRTGEG